MPTLRSVDPTILVPNPANPRRTAAPPAMDAQLTASIKAIGLVQPPRVKETDGTLIVIAGNRRIKCAIAAGLESIDVLVADANDTIDAMASVSENLVRFAMNSVDIWRAIEKLEAQGWNEQAIADALALPERTVRRLKLLAKLHPPMLDVMAAGSMPKEDQLRTIAAASREEQAQVWKKHKPKKGHDVQWFQVAQALSKRRIPFATAKFDADLARAYGVVWEDDLFAPADEESRYTTNVEGFFGAQQEWLANNLPERGIIVTVDDHGYCQLPKKAERVYGKPGKSDNIGQYLDPRTGEVETVVYRMPEPKKPAKASKAVEGGGPATPDEGDDMPLTRRRPDVTQKGCSMIGDLRTDALHQALKEAPIDDHTLLGLLVLALSAQNVDIRSGDGTGRHERKVTAGSITEGGVLTNDPILLRAAARTTLAGVLSCRENMSNSGLVARIAADVIDAGRYLPTMATPDFLGCLSKAALEEIATAEGVRVEPRGKDTRAHFIKRFADSVYIYPGALFKPTDGELAKHQQDTQRDESHARWTDTDDGDSGAGDGEGDTLTTAEPDNDDADLSDAAD